MKEKCEQNRIKLKELEEEAVTRDNLRKKMETKVAIRQKFSDLFIDSRKKMLTEVQESNRMLEVS